MKLLYSTNDLVTAKELASALEGTGIPAHLAGEYSARMPGFGARLTPDALGVWVLDESKMSQAVEVLRQLNLVVQPGRELQSTGATSFWIKAGIVLIVALGTILVLTL
jgi:hypothetical protein